MKSIGALIAAAAVGAFTLLWWLWLSAWIPATILGLVVLAGLAAIFWFVTSAPKTAPGGARARPNQWERTVGFVCAAAIVWIGVAATYPRISIDRDGESTFPRLLFPNFTDPLKARSLELVSADEKLGLRKEFRVQQQDGIWVIPSHDNYPADAEDRIRDAAAELINVEAMGIATELPGEHSMFGVIEPTRDNISKGEEGLGTLVTIKDVKGDDLLRLIVGKEVKGSEGGRRFVRRPMQDIVYVAEIGLDKISTRFEDWIEKDLLKLNPFDVTRLKIRDYSVAQTLRGKELRGRYDIATHYDNGAWKLAELLQYGQAPKPEPVELSENEELDAAKLNDLRNALRDVMIVDVHPKPQGVGADLRADRKLTEDGATQASLAEMGFIPQEMPDGRVEVFATSGELIATQSNGVEYVLRFGDIAGSKVDDAEAKINRYLLVTARLNEDLIEKPDYAPLPELPSEKAQDAAEGEETDVEAIEAERARIEKENDRKREEYESKVREARGKVRELNHRFADWYYVISEDVYKKLRLTRNDLIKQKEGAAEKEKEEGFGIDAFRDLENKGIGEPQSTPTPTPREADETPSQPSADPAPSEPKADEPPSETPPADPASSEPKADETSSEAPADPTPSDAEREEN